MRALLMPTLRTISLTLHAQEPTKAAKLAASMRTWFEHLKEGLTESSVSGQRQRGRLTAVAAVRGKGQSSVDPDKPAWKSGAGSRKAREMRKQKAEFAAAVDLILNGQLSEGDEKLEAFEKAYPASPLLAEARQARAKVREASAAGH